jgi:gliding motility-associated-like protein
MHVVGNGVCFDTAFVNIRIDPYDPVPEFVVDFDSGCIPLTVKFKNQTQFANKYIWYFGDGNRSTDRDPVHTYREPGLFGVTLIGFGPGGEGRQENGVFIRVMPKPFAVFQLTPKLIYLPDAEFYTRNLTTNSVNQIWEVFNKNAVSKGSSVKFEPMFRLNDTGFYDIRLIATSKFGCHDTVMMPNGVYVSPNGRIFVPTAFTPNNNDNNDIFKPVGLNISKDYYLFRIYNSWGEKVYETRNPDEGWDGTINGKECMSGVYVWKVNLRFLDGIDNEQRGVVHLIR